MSDYPTKAKRPGSDEWEPVKKAEDITISIKTLSGEDPSPDNPVYVRVGDELRKVNAPLSITGRTQMPVNAGEMYNGKLTATLHFTDGTSEDATGKDYFVYTDGRVEEREIKE